MPIRITAAPRTFRLLSEIVILTVALSSVGQGLSSTPPRMNAMTLHQELHARGIGSGVRVTEVDGTVLKGTLVELESDSFEVIPRQGMHPTRIPNTQVARIDNAGLPKGAKEAIGILVGVVVVVSLVVIATSVSFAGANV